MQEKMSLDARRELLERVSERYRFARVGEKTQILKQFLATTGYSRKHAISLLNAPRVERRQRRIRRAPRYDERVRQVLIQLWKAANCICSKRLIPFLAELIPALELFGHLSLPDDGEGRREAIERYAHLFEVSIHSPRRSEGRPQSKIAPLAVTEVSIHSPRRSEGRPGDRDRVSRVYGFQSTPPAEARGDCLVRRSLPPALSFNPLPPPKRGETALRVSVEERKQ